jgi:hypothetical protein
MTITLEGLKECDEITQKKQYPVPKRLSNNYLGHSNHHKMIDGVSA